MDSLENVDLLAEFPGLEDAVFGFPNHSSHLWPFTPWPTDADDDDRRTLFPTNATLARGEAAGPAQVGSEKPWSALKQPVYAVVLLAVAYFLVAVVGVISNTLVVTVIYRQPKMRSVTNIFLSNLAVADILVCVSVLPITLLDNIFTEWWYGPVLCKAFPYLQGVSVSSSVNTLAAIAVERFSATFYPKTSKLTSSRSACIIIAFLWIVPSVLFVPWIVVYQQTTFDVGQFQYVVCHQKWASETHNLLYTVGVVCFTCYLLPLVFIGIFYLMIAVRVWQRKVRGMASGSRAERHIHRSKSRILAMLAVVFAVFAVSWLPLYCMNIYMMIGGGQAITASQRQAMRRYLLPLAQWLGASNSCVNPFIYCCFSQNFRRSFAGVISRIKGRRQQWTSTGKSIRATDARSTNSPQ